MYPAEPSRRSPGFVANRDRLGIALVASVALAGVSWITACGDGATEPPPPAPPRATAVTVTPATAQLSGVGATVQLSAQVLDQNGRTMASAAVTWSSGSATIAAVDASGLVTGLGQGTANITAMAGEASGTSEITVTPIGEWGPANTFGFYAFPDSLYPLARIEWTMLPVQAPDESLHEKGLLHYWAMQFLHDEDGHLAGYAGLQSQGVFKSEPLPRRVVNFAIWDSEASNTESGMVDTENTECRCHQIMLSFEWEEATPYRFVVDTGPSGETDDYRWWGLWVTNLMTDSTTFVGETRSWRRRIEDPPVSWGEDLHWWHTLVGNAAYECEDFESSSLAVLDVLGDRVAPTSVHALTSGGEDATGPNGHRTKLCDSAVVYSHGTDIQHNLGYWSAPPRNVLGADHRK